jgi:hypothetical protein
MSNVERRYHYNLRRTQTIAHKSLRKNARSTANTKKKILLSVADILFREFDGVMIDEWECHHIEWIFDVWLVDFADKTRMDYYRAIKTAMEYIVKHDQVPTCNSLSL